MRVLDVNDVAPLFTAPQYLVKAREDLPLGSVVGMVHAHDPDLYQGCNSIDIFEFWVQAIMGQVLGGNYCTSTGAL